MAEALDALTWYPDFPNSRVVNLLYHAIVNYL